MVPHIIWFLTSIYMDKSWDKLYDWKWWSTSSGWFLCDIQRGFGRLRELRPPRGSSRLSCISFSSHLTWLIICKLTQGDNPACPALKQVQVTRILAPPRDADYEVPTKKQTKTLPHSQEAEAWPSDAQRFPTLGFPGCCKPQRSTGTCRRLPFSKWYDWSALEMRNQSSPIFWTTFYTNSLWIEAATTWNMQKSEVWNIISRACNFVLIAQHWDCDMISWRSSQEQNFDNP